MRHAPPPGHDGEEHSDWFWRRRAWPNQTIDPATYPTALAQAERMPMLSSNAGHDGPLSNFQWQPIGPYSIDGRASAITTDPLDSNTFYVGAAAGGLWKTTDHGANWRCLTDTFGSLSIGCVTLDPTNPETIYIGLGECNQSADSYPGDGLWKSMDGGNSWQYLEFAKAQYIAKIIIDPLNHEQLFIAIPGTSSLSDTNRGVFRSTDGGATWSRSLFVRPSASVCIGFIDIAMDPLNSADLVAAAWDHSITIGSNFTPGGPGGPNTGIYRSTDTGRTWARIDTLAASGLPNGQAQKVLGRITLLWAVDNLDSTHDILFAGYIRADTNPVTHYLTDENFEGLYRSFNQGVTWLKILDSTIRIPMGGVQGKDSANITNAQGGYDLFLTAGPATFGGTPNLFLGGIDVFRSTDLGASWKDITNSYSQYYVKDNREQHSDQHGLAFAGTDMLVVSDGGLFETRDFGTTWRQMTGLPITMFYTIEPWRGGMAGLPSPLSASDLKLFGGTQDNGTVGRFGADTNYAWINHGDGVSAVSHPTDSAKLITSLQYGVIFARNSLDSLVPIPLGMKDTTHDTRPRWHTLSYRLLYEPHPLTDTEEAVAWNAPLALDDERPTELYTARCHIYKATLDWNDLENTTWQKWSPILAGNASNDSAWYSGDIETLSVGVRDAAGNPMLWAGGYSFTAPKLWRTAVDPTRPDTTAPRWMSITSGLPAAVISAIVPDRSDSLTAFCATVSASNVAHVLQTTNGGKKWINISGNLPAAPVSTLVIDTFAEHGDPLLKNQVLIAGTDVGVFVTTNGGVQWATLAPGMPHIIVSDLKIYKNMLIAATHGRSLYAIDISSLVGTPSAVAASASSESLGITVFPNPVVGTSSFNIRISGAASSTMADASATRIVGDASCRLIEISSGRIFTIPVETVDVGEYRIPYDPQLSPGAYLVELLDGKQVLGEGRVSIVR